jgi:hypothetical protein
MIPFYFFKNNFGGGGRDKKWKIFDTKSFKKTVKSMKPPRPTHRKFAFKLCYSTTKTKNKETLHFFDRFIYSL